MKTIHPNKVLIVRTDRIGDVILTLPLAHIIRERYPNAEVSFLVRGYTAPLTKSNPDIKDTVILPERREEWGRIRDILRKKLYDTAIVLSPSFAITWLIVTAGIKNRIGTANRWYGFLYNYRIHDHRSEVAFHELEYNVRSLTPLGIVKSLPLSNPVFGITPDEVSVQKVRTLLSEFGITAKDKFVILHPGSGGSAVDLPIEKMRAITELTEQQGVKVILTGSAAEEKLCLQVKGKSNASILAGKLQLEELTALISLCTVFIGNSTGPLHLAAALGRNVIGFYPKIRVCSAKRWGPSTKNKLVFEPVIPCSDCTREQCALLDCMNTINPELVVEGLLKFINFD